MVKKEKIVLIGAGSLQFGLGSAGSILNSEVLEGATISLHDINPTTLDLAYQACKDAIDQKGLNFTLESTTNRKEALKDATFLINSIAETSNLFCKSQPKSVIFSIPGSSSPFQPSAIPKVSYPT